MKNRSILLLLLVLCCGREGTCANSGFYVNASFLYWQPSMDNLDYAFISDAITTETTNDVKAEIVGFDFDWHPGFSVGLGYRPCQCAVDFQLIGTFLCSKNHEHKHVTPIFPTEETKQTKFMIPFWNTPFMGNFTEDVHAKWDVRFRMADFTASFPFNPCYSFTVKPNFGVRGVWIKQEYCALYQPVTFLVQSEEGMLFEERASSKYDTDFSGVGLKSGLDVQIPLFCNLCFNGGFGGSIVYGKTHLDFDIDGFGIDDQGVIGANYIRNKYHTRQVKGNIESECKLCYCFSASCWNLSLSAGYFFSIWFNQNELRNISYGEQAIKMNNIFINFPFIERKQGDLQLQGLIVECEVTF